MQTAMGTHWFIIVCMVVTGFFAVAVLGLTIVTLRFRARVIRDFDRRKWDDC
ncbi:hypothetical protein [Paenibacillus terrigena]|uniref:hypothetical protein n=1 Tax=Paenibacillus terrigena TaxID=369333 RepID=UPI0028D6CDDF|nr:hypothetical protein [Paenibacillus terrigena]